MTYNVFGGTLNPAQSNASIYFIFGYLLWHCWMGGRKGIQPVKNWVVTIGCPITPWLQPWQTRLLHVHLLWLVSG